MGSRGIPLTKASRALFARLIFVIHGLVAIWRVVSVSKNSVYWSLCTVLVVIFIEGALIIFTRNGNENRWFCVSIFLYLCAVVPSLWLLQLELSPAMKARRNSSISLDDMNMEQGYRESARLDLGGISLSVYIPLDNDLWLQLLQQTMLVTVILGRWILPKGDISRDQLSQLLLVFLAMGADIVELFDTFKENVVRNNLHLSFIVLGVWSVSLMQFPLILTGGRTGGGGPEESNVKRALHKGNNKIEKRSRSSDEEIHRQGSMDSIVSRAKLRPWLNSRKEIQNGNDRSALVQVLHLLTGDMGFWAIITSTFLQDVPYLVTRLYLLIAYKTHSFTMIFFTCKNILVVILQWYRLLVISCEYRQRVRFAAYFRTYYSAAQTEIDISLQPSPVIPRSTHGNKSPPKPTPRANTRMTKMNRRMSLVSVISAIRVANRSRRAILNTNLSGLLKITQTERNLSSTMTANVEIAKGKRPMKLEEVAEVDEEEEILECNIYEEPEVLKQQERVEPDTQSCCSSVGSSGFNIASSDSIIELVSWKGSFTRHPSFGSLSATAVPCYFSYASGSPPVSSYQLLRKHRSLDNDSGVDFPFWNEPICHYM